jgi:FkbM family methyltransferase
MVKAKETAYHIKEFLSGFFPDGPLKRKLACTWRNVFLNADFRMSYENNVFTYTFKDVSVKAYENLYIHYAVTLRDFLKYYRPHNGDVIVDCGAYKGSFATYMAKKLPQSKIIAFEPNEHLYKEMVRNIKLNELKNVIPVKKAIWSENKKISFAVSDTTSKISKNSDSFVDAVRLPDELKKLGIKRVNFIKADIEGAEIEMVKSCKQMLLEQDVELALASYHTVNGKPTSEFLERFFKEIGYKCVTGSEHITTYASKHDLKKR